MNDLKFEVSKSKFYNALQIATKAISPNSPVPSLSGIKITAKASGLTLTSSDADLSMQILLSAADPNLNLTVLSEGEIVIDSRYLLEIVRKLDGDTVSVEVIDGTLTRFTGGKAEFKINGFRSSDYPPLDFTVPSERITMKSSLFAEIITETSFAASNKETRPVLTGVNFKADGEKLVCTATDSYRLARKEIADMKSEPFTVTIPARSLNEAKSIFANEENVDIAVLSKKVQFISDSVILQTRLLDGVYPDTDRLIPKDFSYELVIDRSTLIHAIDRAFMKTDNMPIIRLEIRDKDDITISNKSQEIGEFNEELFAVSYEGNPLDISFAGNYVAEAARTMTSDSIRISFTGEMKPFIIRNESENQSILQLVLPVRTYN